MIGTAIHVKCHQGHVEFDIPWKKVRNTTNICYFCPVKHKCKHHLDIKVKVYDIIRENIKQHTIEVIE